MKKIIALVVCLLITASAFAFDPGEKLIWGEVGFDSYKQDKDSDAINTFALDAVVSYFLMKDISLDIGLFWESLSISSSKGETSTVSDLMLGVGGSFYINHFYVNAAFLYDLWSSKYSTKSDDTWTSNSTYILLGGGYLFPLIENVFIDIGADYMIGFGDYTGDDSGKNESTNFGVGAGLVVAIP